jgi:hypothetical protein
MPATIFILDISARKWLVAVRDIYQGHFHHLAIRDTVDTLEFDRLIYEILHFERSSELLNCDLVDINRKLWIRCQADRDIGCTR